MRYGYFDNIQCEYVIEKVDTPMSWTNYIGTENLVGVFNQTCGGYLFYKSAEHHRITRFRGNAVPADRPGHYVYLRDDETTDYWTISWQPDGKARWLLQGQARPFLFGLFMRVRGDLRGTNPVYPKKRGRGIMGYKNRKPFRQAAEDKRVFLRRTELASD